jgi:hypothetical protein
MPRELLVLLTMTQLPVSWILLKLTFVVQHTCIKQLALAVNYIIPTIFIHVIDSSDLSSDL